MDVDIPAADVNVANYDKNVIDEKLVVVDNQSDRSAEKINTLLSVSNGDISCSSEPTTVDATADSDEDYCKVSHEDVRDELSSIAIPSLKNSSIHKRLL